MSRPTHSDKVPQTNKPPLLPKPTHLLKKSNSSYFKKVSKTVSSLDQRMCTVIVSESGEAVTETETFEHQKSVSCQETIYQSQPSSPIIPEENLECHESPSTLNDIEGEVNEEIDNTHSNDINDQIEGDLDVGETHSTSSPFESVPNNSFLYSSKFSDKENLTDLSVENNCEASVSTRNKNDNTSNNRPDSFCDSVSLDSESTDDFSFVRKSLSSLFGSFKREGKERTESFFYIDSNECSSTFHSSNDIKSEFQSSEGSNDVADISEISNVSLSERSFDVDTKYDYSSAEDKKKSEAFLAAKELMTSEQVFIDVLCLITHDLKHFIDQQERLSGTTIIPKHVFDKLINPLPQLLSLNEHLLNDLESRINNWEQCPKISDVIAKKGPFLKLYTTYIKNFEEQCNYLDDSCQKYPKFSKTLKDFESSDRCKKLTLKHYMLKPVQRIPQYRLLLQKYLENLESESEEYRDTKIALNIIHDVLNHANSSIKQGDYLSKLLQIQSLLGNYEIIKPGREFIKEGDLHKLSRKEMQLRHFILLSDCLLYTTYYTSMTGFRVKYELPLCGMKVYLQQVDQTDFSIITSTRSFTLRARSEHEREEWVNALQLAIKEKNEKQLSFFNSTAMTKSLTAEPLKLGREAPVWVQDKQTTMCQLCTAEFTVTFRRHHCRCCGKVVCSMCSNNKAPLQYLKFQPARVCEECHNYLLKEYMDPSSNMFERIKSELNLNDEEAGGTLEQMKFLFKKFDNVKKTQKYVPQRLKEVSANDTGSLMSGWLFQKSKRAWKRLWFVLKDQVLYVYKASHDVIARQSIPVLGYKVTRPSEGTYEEMDTNFIFMLLHSGQTPLVFAASDRQTCEMWIRAFEDATTL